MRTGGFLFAISVVFTLTHANVVFSQPAELESIFSNARQSDRDILVYVHASWCLPCRLLEKNVFPLKSIGDSLQRFVFVSTSLDQSELGALIARKYGITAVPSFLLLNPEGELRHYIVGAGGDSAQFLQILAQLRGPGNIPGYSRDFSLQYPAFYEHFFPSFKYAVDSNEVARYLDTQKDLESEVCFDVFMTHPIARKYLGYFLSHARSYGAKFGSLYCQRVDRIYLANFKEMIQQKDVVLFSMLEDAHFVTDSLMGRDRDRLKGFRYLSFLGKSGLNWDLYASSIDAWEKKFGSSHILLYCDDVYLNCMVPSVCRKMAGYMKAALAEEKAPTEDSYFKYAVLLHRSGEDQEAQAALRRAVELSPGDEPKINQQWAVQLKQIPGK